MWFIESGQLPWLWALTLGWALWPASAFAQQAAPSLPPATKSPQAVAPSSDCYKELLDRLGKMEQRVDRVPKQNAELAHENETLAGQVQDLSHRMGNPDRQGGMTGAMPGAPSSGVTPPGDAGAAGSGSSGSGMESAPRSMGGQLGSASDGLGSAATGGGRSLSRAAGGDPTSIGQAQE